MASPEAREGLREQEDAALAAWYEAHILRVYRSPKGQAEHLNDKQARESWRPQIRAAIAALTPAGPEERGGRYTVTNGRGVWQVRREDGFVYTADSEADAHRMADGLNSTATPAPDERLRAALKDAVRILSGGRQGYVGDHYIREIQVKQTTVDRLRAALATTPTSGSVDEGEAHRPHCNRTDDHDRSGCELTWAELGEYFTVSLNEPRAGSRLVGQGER